MLNKNEVAILMCAVGAAESEALGRSHLVEIAVSHHLPSLSSLLLMYSDVLFLSNLGCDSA